jgi:hypothetical protein
MLPADPSKTRQCVQMMLLPVVAVVVILQSFPCLLEDHDEAQEDHDDFFLTRSGRIPVIARTRVHVSLVFNQLGPYYTPRAYRMNQDNFFALHRLLFPYVKHRSLRTSGRSHRFRQRKGAANGTVPTSTRLAVAIRYFAGGSPYDLGGLFAISVKEVYRSVGIIVDTINNCHELRIQFPMDHAAQKKVALGFKAKSVAGFDCCIGAIDGILIWTECPNANDCIRSKNGPLKYMCGRKKKFGLNMMGTCDAEGRFLNIQIGHPGSTSDYLAFATSDLKAKLEEPGFLAPGMVLFGDNAYGNCTYMVTPIKGARPGDEADAFNFYQSQVRIHVECAFGKLVHRWGVLRRPLHSRLGITKMCAMVHALCRLNNFCINLRVSDSAEPLAEDISFAESSVTMVALVNTEDNPLSPAGLLDDSDSYEDVDRETRRAHERMAETRVDHLPQQILLASVINQGLKRPTPRGW